MIDLTQLAVLVDDTGTPVPVPPGDLAAESVGAGYDVTFRAGGDQPSVRGLPVPELEVFPQGDGQSMVLLDQRWGWDLPTAEVPRLVMFVADAMAVARGLPCHQAPNALAVGIA